MISVEATATRVDTLLDQSLVLAGTPTPWFLKVKFLNLLYF